MQKKHDLYVIEDAAEAHGAVYKNKNIGTLGDMAAYSLYLAHIVTTIEGGIITTDREDFAEILRSLRSHGRACKCKTCVLNTTSAYCSKRFQYGNNQDIRFIFERVGYSSKMNELEAAVGLGNIDNYKEIIEKRRDNLLYFLEQSVRLGPFVTTIKEGPNEKIGPHAIALIVQEGAPFTRIELSNHLEKNGIETRTLFASMPTQCPGFSFLGHKIGEFPNAEYIGNNGLHVGVHQELGRQQIDYITKTIEVFLSSRYAYSS